jgi:3-oxoacyl-[acyl-carrier-protein] synthase-3
MEAAIGLNQEPALPFEKDFLRWTLSDGAGAVLMESAPCGKVSLRIEWVDGISFANELGVCMFAGCQRRSDGTVQSFHNFEFDVVGRTSMTALQQDLRLLQKNIVKYSVRALSTVAEKRNIRPNEVDYFLPHLSSEYFRMPAAREMEMHGVGVPMEKWFTNLDHVGNVGAASIYLALEELVSSQDLQKGQRIWLAVPESGRFMFMHALLTVC